MRLTSIVTASIAATMLSSCTAGKILTAPVRAAGTVVETAVDASTQTESEREEDLGRRVLKEKKQERDACLKEARDKAERKVCKQRYKEETGG